MLRCPLLHLLLTLTDPVVIRTSSRSQLRRHHTLEDLSRKPNKVVSPQGILKPPGLPLALLARQQILISKLARPDPQVANHSQQIEADLASVVPGNAPLQNVHNLLREVLRVTRAVADRRRLQTVELVKGTADGRVGNKVKGVPVLLVGPALRLVDEGTAARKRVVRVADQLRVGERLAADLGRQGDGELAEVAKLVADVDVPRVALPRDGRVRLVEEHAQERLCAARILDGLVGKEEALAGVVVEGAVEGLVGASVWLVRRVLEEEDDAVDGMKLRESVGF